MFMTSALDKTDMKGVGLQMALEILHKKEKKDLITGLRTRTQAGRPDWDKVSEFLDYFLRVSSIFSNQMVIQNSKRL